MLPKSVIACLAAAAFVAATALMPTGTYATGGLQPGTWKWPPYADGGNMHRTACGYVLVNPYPTNPRGRGRWVYEVAKHLRTSSGSWRNGSPTGSPLLSSA